MAAHQRISVEEALSSEETVLIYNPSYNEYLFVSNDMKAGDNILESHPEEHRGEDRNLFRLCKQGDSGLCLLYNPSYNRYLFVSNDQMDNDHVVEAHQYKDEERNKFEFQLVNSKRYRIFNPTYQEYLFVSNDKKDRDHVVESHPYRDEVRNEFELQLSEAPEIINIDFDMLNKKIVSSMTPLLVGQMKYTNKTSLSQKMSIAINKSESVQTTYNFTRGFSLEVSSKFSGGIPAFLGTEITVKASTSFNWSSGGSTTSSIAISGSVDVNAAPNRITSANVSVERDEIEVPYKMILKTKNGNEFISYGLYKGVAWIRLTSEATEIPL